MYVSYFAQYLPGKSDVFELKFRPNNTYNELTIYNLNMVSLYLNDGECPVDQICQRYLINSRESTISNISFKWMLLTAYRDWETDRKSTRLNSSHSAKSRMPSSA